LPIRDLGGSLVEVTIPLPQAQSTLLTETTIGDPSCPAATAGCLVPPYSLALPAALPYLGTFSVGTIPTVYTQIPGSSVSYTVDAMTFHPGSASTPTCSPSELTTSVQPDETTPLTLASGSTITAQTLAFTGCQ
jgi:hypothetical protein